MKWEIDISIGPVQSFVNQSRRTRDLWGGSYLLSYLCAHAMRGVGDRGIIVRPDMTHDALFTWVSGDRFAPLPRIGSVPNHFVVHSDEEPEALVARVTSTFVDSWRRVCQAVWDYYLRPACELGQDTDQIWRRQIDGFWEITWVAAEGSANGLLARRKQWRTHRLPEEPGDRCTVMPDFQELSGHVRAAGGREAQKRFWDAIRRRVGVLELKEEEHLCAVAFVKRFYGKISELTIGGPLHVDHWPSTMYIGAVPWLQQVRDSATAEAQEYVEQLRPVAEPGVFRRHVPLAEFSGAAPAEFFRLDANYYHPGVLTNPRRAPLASEGVRARLVEQLRRVNRAAGSTPPVYYAFLLADGDRLGKQVAEAGGDVGKVSRALTEFGARVDEIVSRHHGVTVYAGGDDVLAMLPVSTALCGADELAKAYVEAFTKKKLPTATLSAAVVYAQVRMPVGAVLVSTRDLLERVAKEGNGRDSLVVAVLKPGSSHCRWVTTWTRRYPGTRTRRAVDQLNELAGLMGDKAGGRDFSSSLLYHTRDTLSLLCGEREWMPGQVGELPAGLDLRAYIRAEVVDSWDSRRPSNGEGSASKGDHWGGELDLATISKIADLVTDLLAPSVNQSSGSDATVDSARAGLDGLLLARFIAGGGREEEHG